MRLRCGHGDSLDTPAGRSRHQLGGSNARYLVRLGIYAMSVVVRAGRMSFMWYGLEPGATPAPAVPHRKEDRSIIALDYWI